jgi:hypothetical protein
MTMHRIIAADWQLQAAAQDRLGAVIVPLEPHPIDRDDIFVWKCEPINLFWFKTEPVGDRLIKKLPYQMGDRLYLAEEWFEHDEGFAIRSLWKADKNTYFDESEWEDAATMPPEAAQYWYEVTGVRVVQAEKITELDCEKAMGLYQNAFGNLAYKRFKINWNAAHPDAPWSGDRWVVVMEVVAQ